MRKIAISKNNDFSIKITIKTPLFTTLKNCLVVIFLQSLSWELAKSLVVPNDVRRYLVSRFNKKPTPIWIQCYVKISESTNISISSTSNKIQHPVSTISQRQQFPDLFLKTDRIDRIMNHIIVHLNQKSDNFSSSTLHNYFYLTANKLRSLKNILQTIKSTVRRLKENNYKITWRNREILLVHANYYSIKSFR